MPTLSVKDVYYDYVQKSGVTHALQGVTTDFTSGKLYALTGRSGSGKTTLLSLIASFDKPKSGDILLGVEVERLSFTVAVEYHSRGNSCGAGLKMDPPDRKSLNRLLQSPCGNCLAVKFQRIAGNCG